MDIVSINGSPRSEGNSRVLSTVVCREMEEIYGHTVKEHLLNGLTYSGCQACSACKGKSEVCILQDDLEQVLLDFSKADIIILSSPIYWGDVTGQMKLFFDRTYSYLKPEFMAREDKHRLSPGKRLLWIQSQGAGADQFDDVFPRYNRFFEQLNYFEQCLVLRACNMSTPGGVYEQPSLLEEARGIARKLVD